MGMVRVMSVVPQWYCACDFQAAYGGGGVMRHCAVGVVACDCAEALGDKMVALAAVGEQHFADLVFSDGIALREPLFQFGEEATQRNAVLQHGLADVGDFGGAFFGFELGGRVGLLAFG